MGATKQRHATLNKQPNYARLSLGEPAAGMDGRSGLGTDGKTGDGGKEREERGGEGGEGRKGEGGEERRGEERRGRRGEERRGEDGRGVVVSVVWTFQGTKQVSREPNDHNSQSTHGSPNRMGLDV
ncbi:hypothetical protein Pmani_022705 [Petrolisthes manimaculis]|uniref:Uncharacterized protein n=1 Tax=Petrolisthes manimaculis TaxID=1843537 RepID=A0AAE1PBA0_9EUCA|nr:hypothetical protein Pmani_022705 [Petrolisthes manimaculis]